MSANRELFRIVHNDSLPPLVEGSDGKSTGLAVDIVRAAAARIGMEIEFLSAAIDQQTASLQAGKADAVLSASTPERQLLLDFSSPVVMTGGALYVRSPDPTPDGLGSLIGKTVVTPRTGPLAAFIRQSAPGIDLRVTKDYEESLARVVSGEAVAAALNFLAGGRIAERLHPGQFTLPPRMFYEQPFAIGVPKGQSSVALKNIDAGLSAIRADGTWQKINEQWRDR